MPDSNDAKAQGRAPRARRSSDNATRFCFAWIDAAREVTFGAARAVLDASEEISEDWCGSNGRSRSRH